MPPIARAETKGERSCDQSASLNRTCARYSRLTDLYEERADLQGAKVRLVIFLCTQLILSGFVLFLMLGYFMPFSRAW